MDEMENKKDYKEDNHINKEDFIKLEYFYNNKEKLYDLNLDNLNKIDIDLEHCNQCNECKKILQVIMKMEMDLNEIISRENDPKSWERFFEIMEFYGFQVTMVNQDTMECNTFVVDRIDENGNLIFDDGDNHTLDMPMSAFDFKNLYKFLRGDNSKEYGSIFKPVKNEKSVENNKYEGFVFVFDSGTAKIKSELLLEDDYKMPPGTSSTVMVRIVNGEMVYEEKGVDIDGKIPPSPGPSSPKKPEIYHEEEEVLIVGERDREIEKNPLITIEPRKEKEDFSR